MHHGTLDWRPDLGSDVRMNVSRVGIARFVVLAGGIVAAIAACQRAPSGTAPRHAMDAAAPGVAPSVASAYPKSPDASKPPVPEGPEWLPPFDFGPPGPMVVRGYPSPLDVSMSDAASFYGWTRAGTFSYCAFDVCCAENQSSCTELQSDGKETRISAFDAKDVRGALKRLRAFVKDEQLTEVKRGKEFQMLPEPLVGTWDFARDLVIQVGEIGPNTSPDGATGSAASLRLGGSYRGEPTAWVWSLPVSKLCREYPGACMEAAANGMAISPDGTELGLVVYERFPSHGSMHTAYRFVLRELAARIYNATALRHHEKKDYLVAAELFGAAVRANPKEELYLYNLACAWSRAGDARALDALKAAIGAGGEKVAKRAKKDADFESLRATAAFVALVGRL